MAIAPLAPLAAWGKHLVLDAAGCSPHNIRSALVIDAFARDLVRRIDMVAYGPPQIVMFGTGNKKGYTLVQLIETSNICAHFVEENNTMYLDVFSCKDFNPAVVKEAVLDYFDARHQYARVLERDAVLPKELR
jgi:S-adenosylmethionine/arginine decarboxylase-like enzyme